MEIISAVDPVYDVGQARDYELCCEVGGDFFSYAVFDTVRRQFIVLKSHQIIPGESNYYADQFQDIISKDKLFEVPFHALRILFSERMSLLVPTSLFVPENTKTLYTYVHELNQEDILSCNTIAHHDIVNIFPVPERFYNLFHQLNDKALFLHSATPMMERAKGKENRLYCNVKGATVEFLLIVKGKVEVCTQQEYCAEEDILYHLLWLAGKNQLPLSEVVLTGTLTEPLLELVDQKLPGVEVDETISGFTLSYLFSRHEPARFMNLYTLPDCV